MLLPLTVTKRDVEIPESVEVLIEERALKLERYFPRITGCRIVVEGPGNRHRTGGTYKVKIDLTVPGRELVINMQEHEELLVAIREAFEAARRQLEDYARLQRGSVKQHVPEPLGRVIRVIEDEGYGFIETEDGREVYFHRNAVLAPGFERITEGARVRFVEVAGDEGPQASTVEIKHRADAGT
ncbi:MAG: HPF/RaiA family ribosome-associated protein [Acidobacteriota bacterium]|nr:MAG: HPF/RaiA family ribosome-associated protein [Acidobacteriota bacterium]